MKFIETSLPGAFIIELERREDDRGFFARYYCEREYTDRGLESHFVQMNTSLTRDRGTLRGMRYQVSPKAEIKVVRCLRGAQYDVIVDLRASSATFGKSFCIELNEENRTMLYIPREFAHGFVTLRDDTEVLYMVSEFYSAPHERGFRWNDPAFKIPWPEDPRHMSERDASYADFRFEDL